MAPYAESRRTRRALRAFAKRDVGSATKYITAGISVNSPSRIASWVIKLRGFLQVKAIQMGHARPVPALLRDNATALEFLAGIADEDKGRTRVAAAIRALNFLRKILGVQPLSEDPMVKLLSEGVRRMHPHAPRGAAPLPAPFVHAIARHWGSDNCWWKRMIAAIVATSFLALLRAAGILAVPNGTVVWVYGLEESHRPPRPGEQHSGALILLPSRKSSQSTPSWVPVRNGVGTSVLAAHVSWRRGLAGSNNFLFPSRKLVRNVRGNPRWVPHPSNRLSQQSLVFLMRQALVQVCGISERMSRRFTAHSMRVGGINYYKRIGVPIGMTAIIASHKSLVTSRQYLRMLPVEKLSELSQMVQPR